MRTRILCLIILLLSLSANAQQIAAPKPFVLGTIHTIHSAQLNEDRTLNIYLPEGYKEGDTSHYPVIYLLDGSADEDFIHVVGLVQFNTFSWIHRLPPSIVVGIANTDRRRDFTYSSHLASDKKLCPTSGGSERFIAFLQTELQPYINKTFRTSGAKMLIGESLGGLLATEILFKKPQLFDKYVIISPSLWWDGGSLLTMKPAALENGFARPTAVYIGVGKEGLTPGEKSRVQEADANLLAEKLKTSKAKNLRVYFDYLPEETHATIGHQAVFNAFRLLYPTTGK